LRNEDSEEFDGEDYEDYYANPVKRLSSNKPKSLVETIASSPGNRALRGNQALFEEFVKLAIERQRWEQAQDVTRIIQSTIPEYSDYYDYPDFEERRPNRRPSQRPKGSSRNRPKRPKFEDYYSYESNVESEENVEQPKRPSISSKRPLKSQSRPSFRRPEERERPQERPTSKDSQESEENFPKRFRPPKSFRQKRPSKKIATTSTTTTEEPIEYEESYYYDLAEYPSSNEERVEEIVSEESFEEEEKIPAETLQDKSSNSFSSDPRVEEQRKPSLNQLLDQRPKSSRKPLFQPRGRPRPRFGGNSKVTETERPLAPAPRPSEQTVEEKEVQRTQESNRPRFKPGRPSQIPLSPSLNNVKVEEKKEQGRPRFRPSQNPRAFRPGRRNNPRPNEFTKPKEQEKDISREEDQIPVNSEEIKREDLLQKLLSHSKSSEKATVEIKTQEKIPKIEQDRSGGLLQDSPQILNRDSKQDLNPLERLIKTAEQVSNLSVQQKSTPDRIATQKPPSSPVPVRVSTDDFRPTAVQDIKPDPIPVVTTTSTPVTTTPATTIRITTTTTQSTPAPEEIRRVPNPTTSSRRVNPFTGSRRPTTEDNRAAEVPLPRESRPSRIQPITSGRRRPVFRPGNRRTSTPPPPSPTTTTAETPRDFSVRPVFKGNRRPVTAPARTDNSKTDALPFPVGETILRNENEERENRRGSLPRRNSPLIKSAARTTQAPAQEKEKEILPLSDTERKSKKQERNNLFKKLLSGRNDEKATVKPVVKSIPKQEEMSPLENLFNIIQSNQETPEKPKPSVKVTSSSSSSSSRSVSSSRTVSSSSSSSSSRSSSSSTGGRRKKVKKSAKSHSRPTEDLSLQQLTPQERLVKKVQETLRNENNNADTEVKDIVRPSNSRKKVIFRKRKGEEVARLGQLQRKGRQFQPGSSQIKSVKVRVRRIEEIPPYPIVY